MKVFLMGLIVLGSFSAFAAGSGSSTICGKVVEIDANSWKSVNETLVTIKWDSGTLTRTTIQRGTIGYDYAFSSLRDQNLNICFTKDEGVNVESSVSLSNTKNN